MIEIPLEFLSIRRAKSLRYRFYIDKYEVTIGQYRKFLEAWRQTRRYQEHPKVN